MKTIILMSTDSILQHALITLLSKKFSVHTTVARPGNLYAKYAILDVPTDRQIQKAHHIAEQIICLVKNHSTYPPYARGLLKPFRYDALLSCLNEEGIVKFYIKDFVFFPALRQLQHISGSIFYLTEKESEILCVLGTQPTPITRKQLLEKIWNYHLDITTHTLETHIYRLRKKLDDPDGTTLQTAERGYVLVKSFKPVINEQSTFFGD